MKLKFFNLAEKLSTYSNHPLSRHGSVIVYKNRIVGVGFNQSKTHTHSPHFHAKQIHAEFAAVLNSRKNDFKGHEIYVFRRDKLGRINESRPCIFCLRMIKQLGFKVVHYSSLHGYKSEKI